MSGKTAQEWFNEGQTLLNLCKPHEALTAYNQAISLQPDYLEALYRKGVAVYALKNYDEAKKIANQIIKSDPKCPLAYSILGLVAAQKKEYDKALELYDQGISLDPSNPQNAKVLVNQGNLYLNALNDELKAFETFHEAIKADPSYDFAYNSLGNALCELRRYEEAIEYYDKAYKAQATASCLTLKAECLVLANKKKEALNIYLEAYKLLQAGKPGIGLNEEKVRFLENEIRKVIELQEVAEKSKKNLGKEFTARLGALQTKKEIMVLRLISKDNTTTVKDIEGLIAEFEGLSNDPSSKSSGKTEAQEIEISLEKSKADNQNKKPNKKVENLDSSKDKTKQAVCCNIF